MFQYPVSFSLSGNGITLHPARLLSRSMTFHSYDNKFPCNGSSSMHNLLFLAYDTVVGKSTILQYWTGPYKIR